MDTRSNYRDNNGLTSSLKEINGVAVYLLNLTEGEINYMSLPILEITGYLPNFFTKKGFGALFEILSQKDFNRVKEKYSASLWAERESRFNKPEIINDVFRIKRKDTDELIWIENTIVILNYSEKNTPKKALGYLKLINPKNFINFKDRASSLRQLILESVPPYGIAQISSLKKWRKLNSHKLGNDSLLQVAFQGALNFKLTKREQEILRYIADGFSAKEIASMLFIGESTVVTHKRNLLSKFEVKNVAELIKVASKHFHFN